MLPARRLTALAPFRATVALLVTLLTAPPAGAAVTLRKQLDLRGDFKLFGTTLAQDRANGVVAPLVGTLCTTSGSVTCGTNTSDSGADAFWRAEPATGTAACGATVTAATARSVSVLQLPAGAVVKYARLYWAGYVAGNAFDPTATLTAPGGAVSPLTADAGWTLPTGETGRWWYQASADVTALVQALPAAAGAWMVSDVDSIPLANVTSEVAFTGWWAVVFYEDPAEFTLRNLTLFDGFEGVSSGVAASATLAGFRVPSGGFDAKLGVVAWEGDSSVSGDQLKFKGYTAPAAPPATLVSLTDVINPANNFFNRSRSHLGAAVTVAGDLPQTTGGAGSLSGMDLDVVDLKANAAIASGNDSATISATSTGDVYVLAGFITSISTLKPDFTNTEKSVVNVDRVGATLAGDRLEYTIVARNAGNDPSVQTVMTDPLPPGITLVPGSIRIATGPNAGAKTDAVGDDQVDYLAATRTLVVRLGTGATGAVGGSLAIGESTSVVFRATVDAGAAGAIDNQATVTAAGQNGQPSTGFPSHPPSGGGGGGGGGTITVVDACVTDLECGGATPACDVAPAPNACVGCTGDAWCGGATPVCDLAARACVGRASLTPAAQEKPAAPGLAVPFDLLLQARQSVAERFNLEVLDGGCAVAVELRVGTGPAVAWRDDAGTWTIDPGSDLDADGRPDFAAPAAGSVPFTLRLSQAPGAALGDRCLAQVVATGFATGAVAPVSVEVRAAAPVTFGPDRTGAGALTVGSGGTVAFAGVIQNNGAVETSFTLSAAVTASPSAGPLADAVPWSDPNGDGDPSDGAPVTVTGPVAPFGGTLPVVLVVKASTGAGAPLPAGTLLAAEAVASATGGGASATQASQAWVGWLVSSADAAFGSSTLTFAPCETVQLEARRLPLADGYALEWYAGSAPVRGVDLPFRSVDPWTVTGGSARDAAALPAGAPDAVTVLLVQRTGAGETVFDTLPLGVERGGAIAALLSPARTTMGQPLQASVSFRSDAQRVTHRATQLAWTVSGGGQVMDGAGAFVAPPATARLRSGVDAAPGATVIDTLSASPAWPAPGRYQVGVAWQLACGASPVLAEGAADVDVVPRAPVIGAPSEGALLSSATPTVTGTGLPGASVVVSIDGVSLPAVTVDDSGRFTLKVPAGSPLAEGAHLVVAVQAAAGLTSEQTAPVAFSTDSLPPSLFLASPAPGAFLDGAAAPLGRVSFAGTAEAGATVALSVDGAPVPVVRAGSGFTAAVTLADGTHLATLSATDPAGNPATLVVPFDLDATPPAAPLVATPVAGQLLGSALAPAGLVAFTGTAEAGTTVTVTVGGSSTRTATSGVAFAASLLLADGDQVAVVTATDAAGNVSVAATVAFRLDTLPPATPAILSPASGARLGEGLVPVSGTAEAGSTVRVEVGAFSATVTAAGDGAFTSSFSLAAGSRTATAVATDAAGNASSQASVTFLVAAGSTPPPETRPSGGGCGCSQGAGAAGGSSLLLLALAASWPRRRRARAGLGS